MHIQAQKETPEESGSRVGFFMAVLLVVSIIAFAIIQTTGNNTRGSVYDLVNQSQ